MRVSPPLCRNVRRALATILICWVACPATLAAPPQQAAAKPQEIWEVYYLQGSKIGYGQTVVRPVERSGQKLLQIDSINRLSIVRFNERTEQQLKTSALEMFDGRLLEFTTDMPSGPASVVVHGRVNDGQMILESRTKGTTQTSEIPWSNDVQGFRAVEQSLERDPIKPLQKRTLKMLMPIVNQVVEVELRARDYETTSVLGVQARLLKIDSVARLPDGNTLDSTIWVDTDGATIKTRMPAMQQDSYRTTREVAIAEPPKGKTFDLGLDAIVKPDKPLKDLRTAKTARYRVELAAGDPARLFAGGPTQSVKSLSPHAAELSVRRLRISDLGASPSSTPVDQRYTSANTMLQSDDPTIKNMAAKARASAQSPEQVALALERYVHETVTNKNFTQTFATAAEVAESREGDCTEHAVLLAALARACGIPSRVAVGLVYVNSVGGFGYHMWTEVYLQGQWFPLDATLGEGGIGVGHLKLTDSALDGPTAYSAFLSVAQVMGQLKIGVLAVE